MSNKETTAPPPQRLNDTEYHQLLELGYAELIKEADASARAQWADTHSDPIIEQWRVMVGEYILQVGHPPRLGGCLIIGGMETVVTSDMNPDKPLAARVINMNLSRTSETLQFSVDYTMPARRSSARLDEIAITSRFLTPQRQQIQHRLLFNGPSLVYWARNGIVGLDRSPKRPST
ncbi:hypothetical protein A2631_02350 [Candidatus Daviesbacteria bacterium RIFCSPHIGHO2_01_FULL_44_29]|uniref:Uncharacterized protein n=1 Tax=Candidatus Daviesbacteria bacterium RIFCSPHIGHO2_02_FULL_43_12 TaxID=1797776 RepID=A0A1F5KJY6_9BACT|nr:MAG: hypothetical protein A2631_02350 [Candidatus Daviesbacteria bacterium RIFCSPHIGHO2_01_FULL_44_29]OGE40982.1 MAG: hypothetical protein A3E86_03605 [Candidatus Daviesbacteria bacterium RIFCSPHIGHO2_12_FULL_47_45]OGE41233.1 MAG: hypothetical protein A3D25_01745 [Candidatus Daviesbacteria bacterium RIFCSPHIGHO2_02_FULL_43_12]OGE69433.1 MAG: hypothetical protein A3B55_03485 [Candidatus Daviesbacteria bacterium RIFCSPLOWO2_01_FULL_43_15]